jgi:hypothetical protein
MERSTVQSCLAAPVFLSRKPYKVSINPRFRLAAGFSYFGRNRPRKRVPTGTKLAQRFAFCPLIQTMQSAAVSLRATRAAAGRVGAFERPIRLGLAESRLPALERKAPRIRRASLGEPDQLVAIDGLTEHDRALQLLGAQRVSCRQANEIALDLRNTAADFGFAIGADIAKSARTGAATVDARE